MKAVEKISREVLGLFEYSKDLAKSNLVAANSSNNIKNKLTNEQLVEVSSVIDLALSQAFQRGVSTFQKSVEKVLVSESEKEQTESGSSFFRKKK